MVVSMASSAVAATTNQAPTIGGTPPTSAQVGQRYVFVPSAQDADGDQLRFVVKNRPSWLNFSYQSGSLQGTPTEAGIWKGITVFVKDGHATRALPAFSINVA
jgi:hypothetical protein